MSIANRTRTFRPSRRFDLLEGQWQQKRYENHRAKITQARPMVDDTRPVTATFGHVQVTSDEQ